MYRGNGAAFLPPLRRRSYSLIAYGSRHLGTSAPLCASTLAGRGAATRFFRNRSVRFYALVKIGAPSTFEPG
jgi:hypothetical protein